MMEVKIDGQGDLRRGTEQAAGYDLFAQEAVRIPAGGRALVQTGILLEMPANLCALVVPRSGLALKHGITVLNAPGLIDPDYRGEIGVILQNLSDKSFAVEVGDRVAQLLFTPFVTPKFVAGGLTQTERGANGFGSTGVA